MMNKKNITTVVFDCDGTLWDADFVALSRNIARKNNIPKEEEEEFAIRLTKAAFSLPDYVGNKRITVKLLSQAIDDIIPDLLSKYGITGKRIIENCQDETLTVSTSYPSTLGTLQYLHKNGYRIYAKSNWFSSVQSNLMKKYGYLDYFERVFGLLNDYFKPNPESAYKFLGNKDPKHFVYVGDSFKNDVGIAKTTGMYSIWISKDINKELLLSKSELPNFIIRNIGQLVEIL